MEYKGIIWTNHILERMKERGLSYDDVYWVFKKPDEFHYNQQKENYRYYRYYNGMRLAVVAKKNERGQWVLMTCWFKELHTPNPKRKGKFRSSAKGHGFWKGLLIDMWRMMIGR